MSRPQILDLHFLQTPGVIAAYVVDTGDGLALVDTGPGSTLPQLRAGLERLGATLADVRHLLLTHVHFDHVGAAGTVLAEVPAARAYVHERGAAHLARPARLLASASQIYGDQMDRLWGQMHPAPPERLQALAGGEVLRLGQLEVQALATPGHATHHLAYHLGDDLFTGDVGGIRLLAPQTPRAPTPPPDIDLDAWHTSLDLLSGTDAAWLHLAHFGTYANTPEHWNGLRRTLTADAERVRTALSAGDEMEQITADFTLALMDELRAEHPELPARYDFACPPWMSVQGLARYWQRRAARAGGQ
ncbi:MBL fold metallo-hydrolase [Deinococcus multiflagellatus]|uniref:MBL fold metallo-hydrolase n=1 Tax=Deinococcus multiflagellatus TaxID=1656887 RepID=A0ABW1ZI46_9DEIO|nr:MBL fold metallo-hydrolase [Deinococcus multiflagellatus]MBZ9712149.1 MBL fold metallo-hydrolase [Deinococcus multiflagellatus]